MEVFREYVFGNQFPILACSILKECDVHLYRQMGGVRDDLAIHEKALDVLIDLLKKEQASWCLSVSFVTSSQPLLLPLLTCSWMKVYRWETWRRPSRISK